MNKNTLFYGAILVALLSLCLLFMFRIVPTAQIWEKYNVLYVDIDADVHSVRQALEAEHIHDVLYPDHDYFPLPSALAPVQYHQFSSLFSYEQLQHSYFFDQDKNYLLYYIPHESIRSVYTALKDFEFSWGLDSQTTIPFIPMVVATLLTLVLAFYSKNKAYFLCIQIPFILYSFVSPFYHIAAAVCVFTFAVFTLQKFWNRQQFRQKIVKNLFFIASLILLFLSSILLGFRGLLLLIITSLASLSLLYIMFRLKKNIYQKSPFKPILIHSATSIRFNDIMTIKYVIIALCSVALLTILALINAQPFQKNIQKALHIPAPSGYTVSSDFSAKSYESIIQSNSTDRLPDLTDYISTAWHFETYPYVRLGDSINSIVLPGTTVERVDYVQNGVVLQEQREVVAVFDDTYIQNIVNEALATTHAGAEKLLSSQRGFSRVGYVQSGTISTPQGAVVFLLISCAFFLYVLISLRIKRR